MKSKASKKKLRQFGLLIGICFPILFGMIIPLVTGHNIRLWTLILGIPFLILGSLKPILLTYPYKAWMKLGSILGWINSNIFFGLVFILVLQPIAFFMRIFGYDPLRKKINDCDSYREIRKNDKIDLTRIF